MFVIQYTVTHVISSKKIIIIDFHWQITNDMKSNVGYFFRVPYLKMIKRNPYKVALLLVCLSIKTLFLRKIK